MAVTKLNVKSFALCLLTLSFLWGLCGCSVLEFVEPERPPYYRQLWETYGRINLKESTAADVLTTIHRPEHELLSQSTSVIASLGQKKRTYHTWFNMVAFDENELAVKRKYLRRGKVLRMTAKWCWKARYLISPTQTKTQGESRY